LIDGDKQGRAKQDQIVSITVDEILSSKINHPIKRLLSSHGDEIRQRINFLKAKVREVVGEVLSARHCVSSTHVVERSHHS
jgi:hypothetical protein